LGGIIFAALNKICYAKDEDTLKCQEAIHRYRHRQAEKISSQCQALDEEKVKQGQDKASGFCVG